MDDKFELPPRRELPEDIKDRMRATVRMRMDDPEFEPQGRGRRFLAAAAAIMVVAVGAAVVVQSAQDEGAANDPSTTTSPSQTGGFQAGNQATADPALVDRCWRAAMLSPQAARYPKRREEWMGGRQMTWGGVKQVGLRLGQLIAGCEVSETTVWLSDPQTPLAPDDPTQVKMMMMTPNGGSALNVRAGVGKVVVGVDQSARGGAPYSLEPYDMFYGVRSGEPRQLPGGARIHVGVEDLETRKFRDVRYEQVPAPMVTVVDQPKPPGERTSQAGKKLAECITTERTKRFNPLVDAELLVPGAYAEYPASGQWTVVGRYQDQVVTCSWDRADGSYRMEMDRWGYALTPEPANEFVRYTDVIQFDENRVPEKDRRKDQLAGFAGAVAEQVAELSLNLPNGKPMRVTVAKGTFIAYLDGPPMTSEEMKLDRATYVAKDAKGKVLGSGPLYQR
ncbi:MULTISPECIES: hypothetical protein [unclassified Crossiella]|uniref:hypothetical protein n=1 Tax=unclassified Crossiella TaxID=2620835 RepID=UPI001FFF3349|nr:MULTISPECIES: hypothetical protein [unclassified Crossiella]MCK2245478.1 hypothetical protein [Crossiella sp. S99.2]MCK2259142.1 hypothetical protein [Crossiella sp. S99.1]